MTITDYDKDIKANADLIEFLNKAITTNNHHVLKLRYEFFHDVMNGSKTFEVRNNDRGFQKGDIVSFIAVDKSGSEVEFYEENQFIITYVLHGWGVESGNVVFSMKRIL